jgi:hypothetical protein
MQAVVDGDVDSNLPHGELLTALAEALVRRTPELAALRQQTIEQVSPAALIETIGTAANFQRMTRIADAIGIPIDGGINGRGEDLREQLGLGSFAGARNSTV